MDISDRWRSTTASSCRSSEDGAVSASPGDRALRRQPAGQDPVRRDGQRPPQRPRHRRRWLLGPAGSRASGLPHPRACRRPLTLLVFLLRRRQRQGPGGVAAGRAGLPRHPGQHIPPGEPTGQRAGALGGGGGEWLWCAGCRRRLASHPACQSAEPTGQRAGAGWWWPWSWVVCRVVVWGTRGARWGDRAHARCGPHVRQGRCRRHVVARHSWRGVARSGAGRGGLWRGGAARRGCVRVVAVPACAAVSCKQMMFVCR